MIELDNKRYSVVTEGSFIEKGEYVEITAIEGSRILVKKVNHHEKTDSYQNNT
jgi:membrane-bound ClpP family serine protease